MKDNVSKKSWTPEEVKLEVEEFLARKAANATKERINNSELWAGADMHFYCQYCGEEDCKPECFDPRTDPVQDPCRGCRELIKMGYEPDRLTDKRIRAMGFGDLLEEAAAHV